MREIDEKTLRRLYALTAIGKHGFRFSATVVGDWVNPGKEYIQLHDGRIFLARDIIMDWLEKNAKEEYTSPFTGENK